MEEHYNVKFRGQSYGLRVETVQPSLFGGAGENDLELDRKIPLSISTDNAEILEGLLGRTQMSKLFLDVVDGYGHEFTGLHLKLPAHPDLNGEIELAYKATGPKKVPNGARTSLVEYSARIDGESFIEQTGEPDGDINRYATRALETIANIEPGYERILHNSTNESRFKYLSDRGYIDLSDSKGLLDKIDYSQRGEESFRRRLTLSYLIEATVLTPTEIRLWGHIASGWKIEDYASDQGVTINTVKTHLTKIFSKLDNVNSQAELVLVASQLGMLSPVHLYFPPDHIHPATAQILGREILE